MRHSPEPWTEDPEGEVAYGIEDRNGTHICDVMLPQHGSRLLLSDAMANLKLIKASPLLLKAAIMAMNWMECDKDKLEEMEPHDQEIYTRTMAELRVATNAARTR